MMGADPEEFAADCAGIAIAMTAEERDFFASLCLTIFNMSEGGFNIYGMMENDDEEGMQAGEVKFASLAVMFVRSLGPARKIIDEIEQERGYEAFNLLQLIRETDDEAQ